MLNTVSPPLFAGRKRQLAAPQEPAAQRTRYEGEVGDTIVVVSPGKAASKPAKKPRKQFVDPSPHLRATLPDVGDTFQSRSTGSARNQAQLISEKELKRDLERHTAFKTFTALDLLLDFEHPLAPDKRSKNPANDRSVALRELHAKVKNPASRLSASSKRYLKSVALIDSDNQISKATRYDVDNILSVSPKSRLIQLQKPDRLDAKTYWIRPPSIR